jgi:predicted 2-oxoglutarate/Fe(II)-dependent dioxygenase YbiX
MTGITQAGNGVWCAGLTDLDVCLAVYHELQSTNQWAMAEANSTTAVQTAVRPRRALWLRYDVIGQSAHLLLENAHAITRSIVDPSLAITGYQFVRYRSGDYYLAHRDNSTHKERRFTVIIYLNDRFKGGETVIHDRGLRFTPRLGHILCFESGLLHESLTVHAGEKWIAVYWYSKS